MNNQKCLNKPLTVLFEDFLHFDDLLYFYFHLSCMYTGCFLYSASDVFVHEKRHSLSTAWAWWIIETRKSAMTLVSCCARLCFTSVLTSHVTYC